VEHPDRYRPVILPASSCHHFHGGNSDASSELGGVFCFSRRQEVILLSIASIREERLLGASKVGISGEHLLSLTEAKRAI
jgi:hypothetical protein